MTKPAKLKHKIFVAEYLKTHNATKSVLKAYPNHNYNSARSTGSRLLAKDSIHKSIDQHLEEVGYTPSISIGRLMDNEEAGVGVKCTASDSIRASELLLKLSGKLVDRKQTANISMNIDTTDKYELLKLKRKYDKLLGSDK